MKEHQKKVIENYVSSYNNFDIEGMIADLDENVVFENITNGELDLRTEGLIEFKKQAESAKQYFRQRKQIIDNWEFDNSSVSIEITYEAILNVDLPNGLKNGESLNLKGKSRFKFEEGRIVKITDES
ncbi:nuclear transport factor 2 family protein [Pontibacter sp. BT310]|uniref:Nuclear transport factor 2 family protein n=1 Tax=Pontibacter populi TaxID=890055 RepID=A0ABS6XDI7_9BACT|nr:MULTISPECIES: nuclear transport factor 2 family protein [Pontibacter]MBJ6118714.1 nuclear transport factor 2 family protein [Pontibacter sp. BT310]MBR0571143.1 nuclear transport factor 2 family protein [Microvirga sp. STS03]MBW3365568.1 nuclear transport factor 2 family protein [Pontibacter populi]